MTVSRGQWVPGRAGLVLLDRAGPPIYANSEALEILAYPREPNGLRSLGGARVPAALSELLGHGSPPHFLAATALTSGRRQYTCRTFPLADLTRGSQSLIAVLLERPPQASDAVSAGVRETFHLTVREGETTALLMHGLTNKEIADRMHVSPNTVKAFLKLVMMKMGVSTRSAVTAKVLLSKF